jgi:type I restriction-modification system DNA methylase subunit
MLSKSVLSAQPIEAQLEWVGSAYESLLALSHNGQTSAADTRSAAEVRRHREGAHYTPPTLVVPIVSGTLDPLINIGGNVPSPETILALRICDPAMGWGAFLIRAALTLAHALLASWNEHKTPHSTHESTQLQTLFIV